jgi:hypothetical protein
MMSFRPSEHLNGLVAPNFWFGIRVNIIIITILLVRLKFLYREIYWKEMQIFLYLQYYEHKYLANYFLIRNTMKSRRETEVRKVCEIYSVKYWPWSYEKYKFVKEGKYKLQVSSQFRIWT